MFSKTTQYALRAGTYLGQTRDHRATSQEIAEAANVSVKYMSKVLQMLVAADIIGSQRGPSGGFWLLREPAEVSLLDIVNAIEPVERIHECPLKLEGHCSRLCPLHRALDSLAEAAESRLASTSILDVMNEPIVKLGMPKQ